MDPVGDLTYWCRGCGLWQVDSVPEATTHETQRLLDPNAVCSSAGLFDAVVAHAEECGAMAMLIGFTETVGRTPGAVAQRH